MYSNLNNPALYNSNIGNLLNICPNLIDYLKLMPPAYPNYNAMTLPPTTLQNVYFNSMRFMTQTMVQPSWPESDRLVWIGSYAVNPASPDSGKNTQASLAKGTNDQTEANNTEISMNQSLELVSASPTCNNEDDSQPVSTLAEEKKEMWSPEKIQLLLKRVQACRYDWKKVAKRFKDPQYTPFQVKSKFKLLAQNACREPRIKFTLREDLLLAKFYNIHGTDWDKIASHFERRTPVMLKNRYYSYIRKKRLLNFYLEKLAKIEEAHKSQIEDLHLENLEEEIEDN